ncbi:MAG: OsmC family protein [Ignavibacteria bacterium]
MAENKYNKLTVINSAGYKTKIHSGAHTIIADEPLSSGGTDMGFNPYDLLLSALGSCKAITIRMFAERRKYPLEDIVIELTHGKIYAEDCQDCDSKEGRIDNINVEIKLTGDLTSDQKNSIIDISKKCPVHKTLISEIRINTTAID